MPSPPRVAFASSPGSPTSANEDWVAATAQVLVVLDGATVRTDTGCRHDVPWFTRLLGASLIAETTEASTPLPTALGAAIGRVAALHATCDLTHPGTPSAAVALVRVEDETTRYAVLGDVTLVADTTDGLIVVTDDRVGRTAPAERAEADRFPLGSPEKAAALLRMKHGELAARNRDGGYWIAAADPAAADHCLTGALPTRALRGLAVLTDGAARAVTMFGLHDWPTLLATARTAGPHHVLDQVRAAEERDPTATAYPRNKKSDDATLLLLVP